MGCDGPPVIAGRVERGPHLADDLRPHMQRLVGPLPRRERQGRPCLVGGVARLVVPSDLCLCVVVLNAHCSTPMCVSTVLIGRTLAASAGEAAPGTAAPMR